LHKYACFSFKRKLLLTVVITIENIISGLKLKVTLKWFSPSVSWTSLIHSDLRLLIEHRHPFFIAVNAL
jgi:hypothetical protein